MRLQEELIDLLEEVSRELRRHVMATLEEQGLSFTVMILMQKILRDPGITVRELARRAGVVQSYVSKSVEQLAQAECVETRSDPSDKRLLRVHLTQTGMDRLREFRHAMRKKLVVVLATVPGETAAELISGLQVVRSAIEGFKHKETTK